MPGTTPPHRLECVGGVDDPWLVAIVLCVRSNALERYGSAAEKSQAADSLWGPLGQGCLAFEGGELTSADFCNIEAHAS